ncbi:MAG: nucleotidyltransferase domain-containing protein [Flavobacteriales bacterium]
MNDKHKILQQIKTTVNKTAPNATLILYGSYARGDYKESSDIDLLILVNKENLTRTDQKKIKYPLYDIEFDTGVIISPMVFSKKEWNNVHKKTSFYENIYKEGKEL